MPLLRCIGVTKLYCLPSSKQCVVGVGRSSPRWVFSFQIVVKRIDTSAAWCCPPAMESPSKSSSDKWRCQCASLLVLSIKITTHIRESCSVRIVHCVPYN